MKKALHIPYIEDLNGIGIEESGNILALQGVRSSIDQVNWATEFPYRPITSFATGCSQEALYIKYRVKESSLKAIYTEDQSPVHKDSCVEFFCMPKGSKHYTNFEFNCIGTCSASKRLGRNEGVVPFSPEEMATIERFSSLGRRPFKEIEGHFSWELTVKIPFALLGLSSCEFPIELRANFYKCGDETSTTHFVSWSKIDVESPDFHRPDFFGSLTLG